MRSEDASSGPLKTRLAAADGADLVILYGGDQRGSMDVCGCEHRPLGSHARVESYRRAVAKQAAPVVLLEGGGFLDDGLAPDGGLRPDVMAADAGMVEGLRQGEWTVWNVGFEDLPYFARTAFPAEAVSANLDGPGDLATWRVVRAGYLDVAVTGVAGSAAGEGPVDGWTVSDPVAAVTEALATLPEADVVVVLAWRPGRAARPLAKLPGVDVLIEVGADPGRYPPMWEGEAIWVRAHERTMRLGELRLDLADGAVAGAVDRRIDLDAAIPSDPGLRRLQERTRRAVGDALVVDATP